MDVSDHKHLIVAKFFEATKWMDSVTITKTEKKNDIDIKKAQMLKSFTNKRRSTSIQNMIFFARRATCAKIQFCRHVQSDLITTSSQWKIWFSYKDIKGGFYFKHKVLKPISWQKGSGWQAHLQRSKQNLARFPGHHHETSPPFFTELWHYQKVHEHIFQTVSVSSLSHVILVL